MLLRSPQSKNGRDNLNRDGEEKLKAKMFGAQSEGNERVKTLHNEQEKSTLFCVGHAILCNYKVCLPSENKWNFLEKRKEILPTTCVRALTARRCMTATTHTQCYKVYKGDSNCIQTHYANHYFTFFRFLCLCCIWKWNLKISFCLRALSKVNEFSLMQLEAAGFCWGS